MVISDFLSFFNLILSKVVQSPLFVIFYSFIIFILLVEIIKKILRV